MERESRLTSPPSPPSPLDRKVKGLVHAVVIQPRVEAKSIGDVGELVQADAVN